MDVFGAEYSPMALAHPCRKYSNGAVGSFTHAVALQGHAYACELEVWADGYHMR